MQELILAEQLQCLEHWAEYFIVTGSFKIHNNLMKDLTREYFSDTCFVGGVSEAQGC